MNALRTHRADVFALGTYAVLALVLTYPLVLHFTTHVPGDGSDDPALAWNLWWVPYALVHLGRSPIDCDYMFYPIGINLAFYTLTYLNALLSIPFQYAFNLVIATNVNVWFSFVVGGFGAYLLATYLLQVSGFRFQVDYLESSNLKPETPHLKLVSFAAGALYAFSSNKFLYASLGQFNIASSHWIPFYVLFLLKATADHRPPTADRFSILDFRFSIRYGFLLGLFLLFQALSEFIYASFLILFTALYLVYWFITHRPHLSSFVLRLSSFVIAVIVFTLPMSPILAAMLNDMMTEGDFIQQGLGFADVFSSDALGFFVPSHLHPIFGGLEARFHFAYTNFAYLGFVALALALLALWKIPRARIWGVWGALFIVISLGPELRVNGARLDLPMPFDLLLEIPFVKGNRYPSRWSVMVTLALAVLVGYGLAWLLHQVSRWQLAGGRWQMAGNRDRLLPTAYRLLPTAYCLLLTALLFEHLSVPLPLSDMRIPSVYQTIARDTGDFTVLEIPLAWRNGYRMTGTLDQAMMFAQFYQTAHRRPILGGNTSRNPELKFQYFTEAPVINSIIAIETGHILDEETIPHDRALAPEVLHFLGVRYVVWHSPRQPHNRAALDAARAYVQYVLPVTQIADVTDDTGETVVFRVKEEATPDEMMIRPGDALARLHFAEGWGALSGERFIWAHRRQVRLFARVDTRGRDAWLTFSAVAPPGLNEQPMTVVVNGHVVGRIVLTRCLDCKTGVLVPARVLRAGMNEIVLRFEHLVPVARVPEMASTYLVTRNGPPSPVNIVARSAGSEVGDFAHIYVNGVDVAPNARGYNLVVINGHSGAIEARAAFDTFASADASAQLAQFIAQIPQGRIVAVAVRDEASRHLTQEAVDALQSIGAREDLRGKWRWSHALIGVKGATPGSVWEAAFETMPAQLVLGIGATEPNVAAAIEWIRVESLVR
jgi:hypothetical protein